MKPSNPLDRVRVLARDITTCEFYAPVLAELQARGLDADDLLEIISEELGEKHCYGSKPTVKYHPGTTSDYYSIWIDVCDRHMFLKLLVATDVRGAERLVVTSFKGDTRNDA